MNPTIVTAIHEKRRLRMKYHERTRLIEPQCYGLGHSGNELVRAHQIEGGSQPEPLFRLSEMRDIVLLDEHFDRPGPNYKKNDSAMKVIYCQL